MILSLNEYQLLRINLKDFLRLPRPHGERRKSIHKKSIHGDNKIQKDFC